MGAEHLAITSGMAISKYLGGGVNMSLGLEFSSIFITLFNFCFFIDDFVLIV